MFYCGGMPYRKIDFFTKVETLPLTLLELFLVRSRSLLFEDRCE